MSARSLAYVDDTFIEALRDLVDVAIAQTKLLDWHVSSPPLCDLRYYERVGLDLRSGKRHMWDGWLVELEHVRISLMLGASMASVRTKTDRVWCEAAVIEVFGSELTA